MPWIGRSFLLALVGLAAVGLGTWGAGRALGASQPPPRERLAVAQRGDLVDSVSASGTLVLSKQEALSFGTAGTLEALLVAEGDRVQAGRVLARLDASTQSSLQKSVAQARVALRKAIDAREALPSSRAKSEAQAGLNLRKAQEALEALKAGPDSKALAAAQGRVATAQVGLDNAERDLALARTDWAAKLKTAEKQVTDAETAYSLPFERYLGIVLSDDERAQDPGALLAGWGADLDLLFDPYARLEAAVRWLASDPTDDPTTRWSEAVLYAWRNFYPARLRSADIRAEMDKAWDTLDKARAALSTQETQSAKALASAENAVAQAGEALQEAQDALTALREPSPADQLVLAEAEVAAAGTALAAFQRGAEADEIALADAEVAAAQSALASATDREAKATLTAPFAGIVGPITVKQGQSVAANATIVTVIDPVEVQLQGAVNEVDVARIQVGQEVSITLDAIPGVALQGLVTTVALIGRTQQGVVSFPVTIQIQAARNVALREGMSASATITVARQTGVILVPPRALRGTLAAPRVAVLAKGVREERAVTISGLTTQSAALTSGLLPGDVLVIPASTGTALSNFQGGFRAFGTGGGGIGIPGGGGGRPEGGERGGGR